MPPNAEKLIPLTTDGGANIHHLIDPPKAAVIDGFGSVQ